MLLVGPPGTGKTLLARAVAGEAGVPFFSISGSEFVEMFVGVGASRVRDLFDQAKRNAPCIVFVDEIDAVGRQRGAGLGGSHDEREQTLNQILVEMDGFDSSTNVIVIAATNRPDVLDPALLRPGRFDRQVILDRPDIQGRKAILEVHVRGKPLEEDVSIEGLAGRRPASPAPIWRTWSTRRPSWRRRKNRKTVGLNELTEAIDRVIAGPQRKSRVISDRERIMTAYHEAGHALVARMLPNADPVHKVTIVARGMMGGYTRVVPDEDRLFKTKAQFEDELAVVHGRPRGRGHGLRGAVDRRRQRHRAGHDDRPADGHRVRHEPKRWARVPSARRKSWSSWDVRSASSGTTATRSRTRSTKRFGS